MLRVVGKPKSNLNTDKAASRGTVGPAQIETTHDTLKAELGRLKTELATIKHELHAARDDDRKELDRLIELFSAYQRLAKSQAGKSALVFQRAETPEVQTELAVQ